MVKFLASGAVLLSAVACSPITPSSSKIGNALGFQSSESRSELSTLNMSSHLNKAVLAEVLTVSQYHEQRERIQSLKSSNSDLKLLDDQQIIEFSKQGEASLKLKKDCDFSRSNEIKVYLIVEDEQNLDEMMDTKGILFEVGIASDLNEKNSNETKISTKTNQIKIKLMNPSLSSKDPVIGSKADKLLHHVEQVMIQVPRK